MLRILDQGVDPPGFKRHICICAERRLFLRINSHPRWQPHHLLRHRVNPFLDWDSYVELRQLCRFRESDIRAALTRADNPLGRLSRAEANELAWSVSRAETLAEGWQRLIHERLVTSWP